MESRHRLALIIPTRNRVELLVKLLQSIQNQNIRPAQIIIVDGSDQPIQKKIEGYLSSSDTYIHVSPPSLTRQRNAGVRQIRPDITIVGFLDDDIEFMPDTVEKLLSFWENGSKNLGGTQFNIINNPRRNPVVGFLTRLFSIDCTVPGKVLHSGFVSAEIPLTRDIKTEWLCGGATVWRRDILSRFHFDEWYAGWAYQEDIDFSYTVSKNHDLYFIVDSKVYHNPPPYNKIKNVSLGKMAVMNRYYFVKKHPELSVFLFYWSTIGLAFINILTSLRDFDLGGFRSARGNISALISIVRGDFIQIDENFRK